MVVISNKLYYTFSCSFFTSHITQDLELAGRRSKGQNCLMGCCSTNLEEQNACHSQVCKNLLFHKNVNVIVLNIYLASTQTQFVKSMNCLYPLVLSVQVVIKLTHFSHGASLSLTAAPADTFLH